MFTQNATKGSSVGLFRRMEARSAFSVHGRRPTWALAATIDGMTMFDSNFAM
jgi:hypothetical protein